MTLVWKTLTEISKTKINQHITRNWYVMKLWILTASWVPLQITNPPICDIWKFNPKRFSIWILPYDCLFLVIGRPKQARGRLNRNSDKPIQSKKSLIKLGKPPAMPGRPAQFDSSGKRKATGSGKQRGQVSTLDRRKGADWFLIIDTHE